MASIAGYNNYEYYGNAYDSSNYAVQYFDELQQMEEAQQKIEAMQNDIEEQKRLAEKTDSSTMVFADSGSTSAAGSLWVA